MQPYLSKFNELCKGKDTLNIQLLEKDTFTIKRARYNQSGAVCYCLDNEETGRIKEKNLWKPHPCNSSCTYLEKDKNGKTACNRIAWLKFFIPEITNDRIWLMRITGQQSIDNIDAYLQLQQLQGNSLNNLFTLFLKQEEQVDGFGKIHKNYILDIIKKEDFIYEPQIPQTEQEPKDLSTENTQNVNNNIQKEQQSTVSEVVTTQKNNGEIKETTNQKKQTKGRTKKVQEKPKEEKTEKQQNTENINNYDDCYIFKSVDSEIIKFEDGKTKEYIVGKFYDIKNQLYDIILKPEIAIKLQNCELGTVVKFIEVKEINGRKFAINLKFIQKMEKNIAA